MFDGVIPLGEALRPLNLFRRCTRVACPQQSFGSRPRRISVGEGDDARGALEVGVGRSGLAGTGCQIALPKPGSSGKDTDLLGCGRDRVVEAAA
jgi:hypothetical protein